MGAFDLDELVARLDTSRHDSAEFLRAETLSVEVVRGAYDAFSRGHPEHHRHPARGRRLAHPAGAAAPLALGD